MFRVAKIRKASIMVLHKDLFQVTKSLGEMNAIEIIPPEKKSTWNKEQIKQVEELQNNADKICKRLGVEISSKKKRSLAAQPNTEELQNLLTKIEETTAPLLLEKEQLLNKLSETEKSIAEVESFAKLELDFKNINDVSFLYFRYGSVPLSRLEELLTNAGERSLIFPAEKTSTDSDRVPLLAVSSKKGRFALETTLSQYSFQDITIPEQLQGVPSQIIAKMVEEKKALQKQISSNGKKLKKLIENQRSTLEEILAQTTSYLKILTVAQLFEHTEYTATINCWIPAANSHKVERELNKVTSQKVVIESKDPLKIEKKERGDVPILLHNRKFIRPFEFLLSNYGYPKYGEIEPTPIVALGFIIMFGIMFGDVGQGAVLMLMGFFLYMRKKLKENVRLAGLLIMYAGASAACFGIVYGSVFCDPHIITPLWKEPLHDIMTLLAATILFGILWINVGLLLNMINKLRSRNFKEAIFEKTGLLGIAFYWGALYSLATAFLFKKEISSTTILLLTGVPLLLLFLREPLYNLCTRRPLFEHGVFTFIMEGIVEVIDTLSYFLGNTVSFVRVGAFALAHSGLSLAFIKLAEISGNGIAGVIVLIFGNLLIILLEGLVVSIQTLRLEYYEFFSKFYSGEGTPFQPFSLTE